MKIDLENFVSEFNKEKFPGYYVRNAKMYGWYSGIMNLRIFFRRALNVILILKHRFMTAGIRNMNSAGSRWMKQILSR